MLGYEELEEVIEAVTAKIMLANRTEILGELLRGWGLQDLIETESVYDTDPKGKIVVIAGSEVKEKELLGVVKSLGFDKSRFEFCLEYEKTKMYNYKKLRYNPNYRVVMFGAVPHSSKGKNDSGSVISEMQTNEGYPRVVALSDGNCAKLTKSNFKEALQKLIDERYI